MEQIFWIFVSISALFFFILAVREFFNKKTKEKICSICFAVGLTWLALLILYWKGIFTDEVILALLIGQSSLGIFYLWEKNVNEKFLVFRLPFLLTLILIAYSLISGFNYNFNVIILLILLWAVFGLVFIYRQNGKAGSLFRKIVECCRRW